jgi:hypothetical protein
MIFIKDFFSNFVQFLVQNLDILVLTTYPKLSLKNSCGFYRITDLGILHFYFSSKNYSSKVYTYLEKAVVLVTLSTTKLGLLFLNFLYHFISILQVSARIPKRIRIF